VTARSASKVSLLPREIGSLSRTDPPALPGTLFVLGSNGGMRVAPDAGFTLLFGRNEPEVHVGVGTDDTRVSRRQGLIFREPSRWVLHNIGRLPILLPGSRLVLGGDQADLPSGYTPLFVVSARHRHLVEVRSPRRVPRPTGGTGRAGMRRRHAARCGSSATRRNWCWCASRSATCAASRARSR
jgi:pSer/pThr/pTyr-binding forkhead associated (FHA) protein